MAEITKQLVRSTRATSSARRYELKKGSQISKSWYNTITIRRLVTLFVMLHLSQVIWAQELEKCKAIAKLVLDGVNKKSITEFNQDLSSDFEIAGQKGEIALMVLNQLFLQLNDTVISRSEISAKIQNNEAVLKYDVKYQELGEKVATLLFNVNNELKELVLFDMEVKTIDGDSDIKKNDENKIEIPFEMAGNLIAVDVMLNGEKRKFLLDSGSPRIVLNSKYIEESSSLTQTLSSSKDVHGSINGMDITHIDELNFAGITMTNQDVIQLNLSHIEEELESELYGLIGFEIIKDYDLLLDYKRQMLTLISPHYFETYKNDGFLGSQFETVPFILEQHIPVIRAKIGKKELNLGVDTGAESNLLNVNLFKLLKRYTINTKTDSLIGASKEVKILKKGQIKTLEIGKTNFNEVATLFGDISHLNEGYGISIDGLVGFPVLSQKRTLISFARKEVVLIEYR